MTPFVPSLLDGDWQIRLEQIVEMMRDMSRQTDPEEMIRSYGSRVRQLMPSDRGLAISRRGLNAHQYRVTRSSTWKDLGMCARA